MRMRTSGYAVADRVLALLAQLWLPVLLIGLWLFVSRDSTNFYFPPLHEILGVLWTDLAKGTLLSAIAVSIGNVAMGLAVAIVLGIASGLVIGQFEGLRRVASPTLNFLRAVPPASIVPIVIIALGVGAAPKVFVIALGSFWPILLNTIDGVRGTSAAVRDTVRAYRIPTPLGIWRVSLPAALPQIMAGIRVALAVALVLMVISEFFGADSGIGFYISDGANRFATRQTWAGTILVGTLGYVLSALFLVVERRLLGWYFQDTPRARHRIALRAAGREE